MTNKTNGIDVSECPLFDKKTGCYHTFNGECVKDSCAVYKWLLEHKRLQEENEELKAENEQLKKPCLVMPKVNQLAVPIEEFKKLQEENEKLKEKNTELLNLANNGGALLIAEKDKTNNYKQALENIKLYINQECKNKQCPQTCANCFIGNILIKINEVSNEQK